MEVLRTLVSTQLYRTPPIYWALDGIINRLHGCFPTFPSGISADFGATTINTWACTCWLFIPSRGWIQTGRRRWKY